MLRPALTTRLLRLGTGALCALAAVALARTAMGPAERTVLVVRRDVAAGVPVARADLERRTLGRAAVPPDALSTLPAGTAARIPLLAGTVLTARHLAPALADAATRIVAVRATPGLDVAAGDVVDVHTGDEWGPAVDVEGATVVRVEHTGDRGEIVVLLAVDRRDVPALAGAATRGAPAALALVPPGGRAG